MRTQFSTPSDRFWSKVAKCDGCWIWGAAQTDQGYGSFRVDGRSVAAHRWAYVEARGPVPEGLELDHLCRNRSCVRPDHLEAVTHVENVRRGRAGWNSATKMHCPRGHPYTGANLMLSRGSRLCRTCQREHNRLWAKARRDSEREARAT